MTADENKPRSSLAVGLVVVSLLLPLAYVLSLGPVIWLVDHGGFSPSTVALMTLPYAPLGLLRDNCAPFGRALDWYIDLWG